MCTIEQAGNFGPLLIRFPLDAMRDETQDSPLNQPKPVVCPACGADMPAPKLPSQTPLIGYHHCRACGFVFREQTR
jgi:hypothetical protein